MIKIVLISRYNYELLTKIITWVWDAEAMHCPLVLILEVAVGAIALLFHNFANWSLRSP